VADIVGIRAWVGQEGGVTEATVVLGVGMVETLGSDLPALDRVLIVGWTSCWTAGPSVSHASGWGMQVASVVFRMTFMALYFFA
jgi:hypothetical protein